MSLTRVDLPEPLTPVTAMNWPSGKPTSRLRRLCSRAPCTTSSRPAVCGRRVRGVGIDLRPGRDPGGGGGGDRLAAGQVRAGGGLLVRQQALDRAAVHDVAAVLAGAGADVDDP